MEINKELLDDAEQMIHLPDFTTPNKAVTIIAIRAMECALSVGEIHFETCILSSQVKKQLIHAIKLLKHQTDYEDGTK